MNDRCGQELCRNWTGEGWCACDALDIDRDIVDAESGEW